MSDTRTLLLDALYEQEESRPRSLQVELGPSSLGSCRRQVVLKLMRAEEINHTDKLAAIMGTAIHETIERALRNKGHESVELTVPGIDGLLGPGHIDLYQPALARVTDWKTTTKRSQKYFPYLSQRWQVQTYGLLVKRAGYPVNDVELVSIARDGGVDDIRVHTEPYDEAVALEALAWLEERNDEAVAGVLPPAEKPASFCAKYCPFYGPDLCVGK